MTERLRDYYNKHGHSLVTASEDPVLHRWTVSLRRNYKYQVVGTRRHNSAQNSNRPKLSPDQLEILQELDFCWDAQSMAWTTRYQELEEYKEKNGHCRVPANFPGGLGIWVRNQRRLLEQPGDSGMPPKRRAALERLGFTWFQPHLSRWKRRYDQLREFYDKYGHSNVPEDYSDNFQLGQWCMNQRSQYKRYCLGWPTALCAERIQKLEALDFRWNYRDNKWFEMVERLKQYYELNGHIKIPTYDVENQDLRLWLIVQRYYYNRRKQEEGPLTERRIDLLQSIMPDFPWQVRKGDSNGPKTEDWAKLFDAMRAKGIGPGARPKQHWFEGVNRFEMQVKDTWTEKDLIALWNQADDDDD
ncbi:hypothetical protein FisN_16Hh142 [Fistulifera solaris]|jgi:hypothetical protein|uniref:Helicase-associated domain-containing protein n=1 Tax=Fistulifera solaris TaxID=1519565 RepID=A0A1Z5KTV3_FISSO|nr:hypothetical protein FisN_16Hh142 [Fistulifera solaris]|eukprot:GAX29418.1 hypothetical protein FisN_16Hh142 [Fistulifera solaris]